MTHRRIGIVIGLGFLGVVLILAVIAIPFLRIWVVGLLALVVLIAGGNWLNSWLGIKYTAQEFEIPDRSTPDAEGTEESA